MKAAYETQCPACLGLIHKGDEIESRQLVVAGEAHVDFVHRRCNEDDEGPLPTFGKTAPPKGGSWR